MDLTLNTDFDSCIFLHILFFSFVSTESYDAIHNDISLCRKVDLCAVQCRSMTWLEVEKKTIYLYFNQKS